MSEELRQRLIDHLSADHRVRVTPDWPWERVERLHGAVPRFIAGFAYRLIGGHMEKRRIEDPLLAVLRLIDRQEGEYDDAVAARQLELGTFEVVSGELPPRPPRAED